MALPDAARRGGGIAFGRDQSRLGFTGGVLGWVALLAGACALAVGLSHAALRTSSTLAGAIALIVLLALVIVRFDLAVALGFSLCAVVLVEPAPSDVAFILVMLVAAVTGRFRLRHLPKMSTRLVAGLIVVNVLSLADVTKWSVAGRFLTITVYLALFSLWAAGYVDRPARSRMVARTYLVIAVLSSALGAAALMTHFPGSSSFVGDQMRAKALFKDPNVFGPFLVPIAMVVAEELLRPRLLKMRRPAMLVTFLVLTLGVLFSYSRAAWLNYAVASIVLIGIVVLRRPDRRALALVMVVIVGGIAVAGATIATGSFSFLKERAQVQNYDTQRFAAQSEGLRAGLDHPFGIGPGQFDVVSPVSTHSLYVRSLSEQGLAGLAVVVLIVVATLVFGVRNVVRGSDTYGISAAALLAAWCGLIVNGFFVDTLHWRHLWLIAALIWAGAARRHAPSEPHGRARIASARSWSSDGAAAS